MYSRIGHARVSRTVTFRAYLEDAGHYSPFHTIPFL